MTPEERAKRVMFGDNAPFMDDDILTASHGYIISYPQLVAAIRKAVMAEREASARVVETFVVQGIFDLRAKLAAAIRARTP